MTPIANIHRSSKAFYCSLQYIYYFIGRYLLWILMVIFFFWTAISFFICFVLFWVSCSLLQRNTLACQGLRIEEGSIKHRREALFGIFMPWWRVKDSIWLHFAISKILQPVGNRERAEARARAREESQSPLCLGSSPRVSVLCLACSQDFARAGPLLPSGRADSLITSALHWCGCQDQC